MPFANRQKRLEYLRVYNKTYQRARYERAKTELIMALGGKCVNCGATTNLEFHHTDPQTKEYSIMRRWKNVDREELAKCVLLCEECHKECHRHKGR